MDPSRLNDAVAARVVAWHNRHPLARRIGVAQVHSVGYVLLPFALPVTAAPIQDSGGGSLRERALARSRQGASGALPPALPRVAAGGDCVPAAAQAGFDEDFIAPLAPRRVARWARLHGRLLPPGSAPPAPLREVLALPLAPGMQPLPVLVLTAAIDSGRSRRRVLLATGHSAAVLGRRLPSLGRGGLLVLLLAASVAAGLLPAGSPTATMAAAADAAVVAAAAVVATSAPELAVTPTLQPPAAAPAAESAASVPALSAPLLAAVAADLSPAVAASPAAPVSAAPASSSPVATSGPEAVAATPAARAGSAATVATGDAVPDVEPRLGRIELPPLGLPHEKGSKATAREAWRAALGGPPIAPAAVASRPAAARARSAAPAAPAEAAVAAASVAKAVKAATAASTAPGATVATAASTVNPATVRSTGPASFAVSSRLLRTRAEAEQVRDAMQGLLRGDPGGGGGAAVKVEVMPQGDDFRVVGWPFGQRGEAEKARTVLISRGMRIEVVAF